MGSIRKRPGRSRPYEARYRGPDGRQRSKSFLRRLDAQRWLTERERERHRGEWVDPALAQTPFAEWCARVQAGRINLAPSTRARDESILRSLVLPTFGGMELRSIQPSDIREWVTELVEEDYAANTVRKAYQLLAQALAVAVQDGFLVRSPCRSIALPKVITVPQRFLSPPEVEELAGAIDQRYRVMVLVGAYAGLRFGEAAGLRVERLDLLRRALLVQETVAEVRGHVQIRPVPKSRASHRTVSLDAHLAQDLAEHLTTYPVGTDGFLFSAPEGGGLHRTNFRRRFWQPAVRASVGEPCRFHDLRHTHVAFLIEAGEDPKVIQERLGHASIRVTYDTYGHLFPGRDERAAERLAGLRYRARVGQVWAKRGPEVIPLRPE
ncbi:MAG: tyrosine-type recombinase/integrase [Acidimicrobiia bacterium]